MKKLFLIVAILFIASGALLAQNKKTFIVENISCGKCANNVKKLMGAVEGVKDVTVDIAKKEVVVDYDATKTTIEKIAASLEGSKYKIVEQKEKDCCEGKQQVKENNEQKKEGEDKHKDCHKKEQGKADKEKNKE